jgi:hypothetical protein
MGSRRLFASVLVSVLFAGVVVAPSPAHAAATLDAACPGSYQTFPKYALTRFADVATTSTHSPAIACMVEWRVALEAEPWVGDGRELEPEGVWYYRPKREATRAEFAQMLFLLLVRAEQRQPSAPAHPFTDLRGHRQEEVIAALWQAGVIAGTSPTTFSPDRTITRGQMASLIVKSYEKIYGRQMPLGRSFSDTAGTTHEANIRRLVGANIASGYPDGTFRPDVKIVRDQMTTFHARYAGWLVTSGLTTVPAKRQMHPVMALIPPVPPPSGAILTTNEWVKGDDRQSQHWYYEYGWQTPVNYRRICDDTITALAARGFQILRVPGWNTETCNAEQMYLLLSGSTQDATLLSVWADFKGGTWRIRMEVLQ